MSNETFEEWFDVVGHEDRYKISNTGRLKSKEFVVMRNNGRKQTVKEKEVSGHVTVYGYRTFSLSKNKKKNWYSVTELLVMHFFQLVTTSR